MFFAEGEEKEFPKKIRKEIDKLECEDKEIYQLNKKKKEINLKVINFVITSLNLFLKYKKKLNKKQKRLITEAIGNIPLTFFVLDELKVDEEVEKTIDPLIDIIDANANLHINREELVTDTLKNLIPLKEKYKKS